MNDKLNTSANLEKAQKQYTYEAVEWLRDNLELFIFYKKTSNTKTEPLNDKL